MIAHDQILPSFYQLQRLGLVKEIGVGAQRIGHGILDEKAPQS